MLRKKIINALRVPPGQKVRLKDYDSGWAVIPELKEIGKEAVKDRARDVLAQNLAELGRRRNCCGPATRTPCCWCSRPWTPPARTARSST
jgi:hypothetical protein